jgi:hypothetical protein
MKTIFLVLSKYSSPTYPAVFADAIVKYDTKHPHHNTSNIFLCLDKKHRKNKSGSLQLNIFLHKATNSLYAIKKSKIWRNQSK